MSSVKVQGNASGTGILTIAAPNTNSDRTLTLPDQTGTVLTNAGPFTANASTSNGAVTIDASGNVGIGVTPSAWGANYKVIQDTNSTLAAYNNQSVALVNNAYDTAAGSWKYSTSAPASFYNQSLGAHTWYNAASGTAGNAISFTQAMTLDSSGNFLFNKTSTAASGSGVRFQTNDTSQFYRGGDGQAIQFFRSSSQVGSISVTGTATAYNTSSDYRLKEAVAPMTGALAKVAALKPVTYKWKLDGSDGEGFIAHELAEVVPGCVTGEKDAVDAEGNPVYQGIDTSFLVATLTAAIQEQQALIESLTARIAALEAA